MNHTIPITLEDVRALEERTNSNVRLGRYDMGEFSPTKEFDCYKTVLDQSDLDRLFLLSDFHMMTRTASCKLADVQSGQIPETSMSRISRDIDLTTLAGCEIEIVSPSMDDGPLVIVDGNHRVVGHFLNRGTIQDVPAFVCIHRNILVWPHVPSTARTMSNG